jgi:hypothetical protein
MKKKKKSWNKITKLKKTKNIHKEKMQKQNKTTKLLN